MLKKQFLLGILLLVIVVLAGCGVTSQHGGGGSATSNANNTEGEIKWVSITPSNPIIGQETDRTAGSAHNYQGVFLKDRNVTLIPYSIAKHELTHAQWLKVYNWAINHNYTFIAVGKIGSDDLGDSKKQPVTNVTWRDSIVWCNAYTEMTDGNDNSCVYRDSGDNVLKDANEAIENLVSTTNMLGKKGYRLPTEAEWEYAARWQGTDSTNALDYGGVYLTAPDSFSGATQNYRDDDADDACGWWNNNSGGQTHNVGQKQANALGLYDMSGNVWEWCFDRYRNAVVPTGNYINPISNTGFSSDRLVRGGTYDGNANNCVVCMHGKVNAPNDSGWWQSAGKDKIGLRIAYSQ